MEILLKGIGNHYPKKYESEEEVMKEIKSRIDTGNLVSIELKKDPVDIQPLRQNLDNVDLWPNMDEIEEEYMENYSLEMLYPGCPEVRRGVMDCDPAESPEFDLPGVEDYKEDLIEMWGDKFIENVKEQLKKEHIDNYALERTDGITSVNIPDDLRRAILERAEQQKERWPKYDDELIEKYIDFPEEYER